MPASVTLQMSSCEMEVGVPEVSRLLQPKGTPVVTAYTFTGYLEVEGVRYLVRLSGNRGVIVSEGPVG